MSVRERCHVQTGISPPESADLNPGWDGPKYIRNPPLLWTLAAADLGPTPAKVGLLLWYLAGLRQGRRDALEFTPRIWKGHVTDRQAVSRALLKLEAAGLIVVDRRQGRSPAISLLEVPQVPQVAASAQVQVQALPVQALPAAGSVAAVNSQAATFTACRSGCEGAALI